MLENPTIKRRYIPKVNKTEEGLQRRVCSYLRNHYSTVIFRSDYASGLHLTKYQGATHKSLQSSKSWPDLFIYCPRRKYHGLAIELKKEGTSIYQKIGPNKGKMVANPHIREQADMLRLLNRQGYLARFAVGYDEAIRMIDWYFEKPENQSLF